ncbi:MAG TPA: transglutaminase-like domain-containing protein [Stellaceae bacterium]|nr:transglutaminase-like domain-containing protein [Stellaceae bacterium]
MELKRATAAFHDRPTAQAFLRDVGQMADEVLPLGEAALALAALDRPRVDLARYRGHLDALAREVSEENAATDDILEHVHALTAVIDGRYGYHGDTLTYEDLQNANLMRVIDRRKGLPVALGILYIHAGRAQGWNMAGLAFPGHFLVRLERGARVILDPFHGGRICAAAELRDLLKVVGGNDAELSPQHYAAVSDREILLRLQNNVKLRLIESQQLEKALVVLDGMTLFAPHHAPLWREAGMIAAQLGNLRAAIASLERFVALSVDAGARHQATAFLRRLKTRLQ